MARIKSSFEKMMQAMAHEFREETGAQEMDLNVMFDWAVQNGRYDYHPTNPRRQFKREMSRALAHEKVLDPQGREVRKNHAFRVMDDEGQYVWEWAPIETIRPQHMQMSLTLRREAMIATALQHKTDWASYNDNNLWGAQLTAPDYNINLDLEEGEQPGEWPDEDPSGQPG